MGNNPRLKEILDSRREEYLKPLLDLISLDTHCIGHGINGGLEKSGQDYMAALLTSLGADVRLADMNEADIQKAITLYQEGNPGHDYKDRFNVYGFFPGGGGRSLMFNGHMDTMPAEKERWSLPPHTPTLKDGKLYGLGASDMKAGLMGAVMAVKLLKDAGIPLPGEVVITSVADEEGGGNGSIAAAMQGLKADGVIVCEPTGGELIAAHMGFVFFRVRVPGLATQAGLKRKGRSAIEKSIKLISALGELEHGWLLQYKHPLLPPPSLNVGTIHGGSAGSTVPGECTFEVCVHYLPRQMTYGQVVREFTEAVDWACKGDEWLSGHRPEITLYQAGGAFEMDVDHPFTDSFRAAREEAVGTKPKIVGSPAGSDSRTWHNIAQCPTLQFGPGTLEQCHAIDENIEVEDYFNAILTYAEMILKWCERE